MHRVFYHQGDLDGWTSAAIYALARRNVELRPIEYGDTQSLELFLENDIDETDVVVMLDFCPNDPTTVQQIMEKAAVFYWIDHHKTSRQMYEDNNFKLIHTPPGQFITDSNDHPMAACELTYMFVHNVDYHKVPYHIRLLGRYDIWEHKDPSVIPFQYAMQAWLGDPVKNFQQWKKLVSPSESDRKLFQRLIDSGKYIRLYEEKRNNRIAEDICFELEFDGYNALAANVPHVSSSFFSNLYDPRKYDLVIAFGYISHYWKVSLRSQTIDCSELAKRYGGGGHKGAAGFICDTLPNQLDDILKG
jgi:uncharacterized protein